MKKNIFIIAMVFTILLVSMSEVQAITPPALIIDVAGKEIHEIKDEIIRHIDTARTTDISPIDVEIISMSELVVIENRDMPDVSAVRPDVSDRELMESSSHIVRGRVVTRSEPFTVENTRGGMTGQFASFVDYSVEIYEVLRGDSSVSEIAVRVQFFNQPNQQANVMPVSSVQQALEIGGEYLLFLSLPGGSLFDTPGHYYYLNWGSQGIFARENEMTFIRRTPGGAVDLAALRDELIDVNAAVPPPTEEDNRQRMLDTLYHNMTGILNWNEDYWQEAINRPPRPGQIISTEESQDSFSPLLLIGISVGIILVVGTILYIVKPFRKKRT